MDATVFEELKSTGNLPSPAGVGLKILQITDSEDYEVADMSRAIMADSSLTGRILQLANSTTFGTQQPATTVDESIMRLGSATVRNLSLAFSLVSARKPSTCKAFDYSAFWSTSLARAVTAGARAAEMGIGRPEDAYICGLLSDIGRLALASVFPEGYAEILVGYLLRSCEDIRTIERERFDIDHIQVTDCMAADWKLPEAFRGAISKSLEQREISPGESVQGTLTNVLRLADALASAIALNDSATPEVWAGTGERFRNARLVLESNDIDCDALCERCIGEWAAWGSEFQIDTLPKRNAESLERLIASKTEEHQRAVAAQNAAGDPPLPAAPDEGPLDPTQPEPPSTTRILVVDDEPVSLRVLQMQLHHGGYEVITATSGQQALKLALERCPDIVVADWRMPEMNGIDLCRSLRRSTEGRGMYFLLVTGSSDENIIVEAFDAGVDDFVTKPFLPQVMGARIKGGERLVQLNRKVEHDKRTMRRQVAELGVLTRKLRAASLTDALTELPNRRYALKRLETEWAALRRSGGHLTLMMLDIDSFKSVNDTYGHNVGDLILKETANILGDTIRTNDEVCRVGGEEFLVICKNTTEQDSLPLAERLRSCVEAHTMPVEEFDRELTISLGIAEYEPSMASIDDLLRFADTALYAAKHGGRNRYVPYSDLKANDDAA